MKDLNLLEKHTKNQVANSILKVVFAFSKWPHLHRAYVVEGCLFDFGTVFHYEISSTEKYRGFEILELSLGSNFYPYLRKPDL